MISASSNVARINASFIFHPPDNCVILPSHITCVKPPTLSACSAAAKSKTIPKPSKIKKRRRSNVVVKDKAVSNPVWACWKAMIEEKTIKEE